MSTNTRSLRPHHRKNAKSALNGTTSPYPIHSTSPCSPCAKDVPFVQIDISSMITTPRGEKQKAKTRRGSAINEKPKEHLSYLEMCFNATKELAPKIVRSPKKPAANKVLELTFSKPVKESNGCFNKDNFVSKTYDKPAEQTSRTIERALRESSKLRKELAKEHEKCKSLLLVQHEIERTITEGLKRSRDDKESYKSIVIDVLSVLRNNPL